MSNMHRDQPLTSKLDQPLTSNPNLCGFWSRGSAEIVLQDLLCTCVKVFADSSTKKIVSADSYMLYLRWMGECVCAHQSTC